MAAALILAAPAARGWSPEGHQIVGLLALEQVSPPARQALERIVGSSDPEVIAQACNWPDDYRASPDGAWSAPDHYINVPRREPGFDPARDCVAGACVAGAIQRYVPELANPDAGDKRRWRAWARVCHFVGDVHQPLHVGFVYDRGGNDTPVVFRGQEMDLHEYWDHVLIDTHYPQWRLLVTDLAPLMGEPLPVGWQPAQAEEWARASHAIARQSGYPPTPEISPEFTGQSWRLAREQLILAGRRLAQIVNTALDQPD